VKNQRTFSKKLGVTTIQQALYSKAVLVKRTAVRAWDRRV